MRSVGKRERADWCLPGRPAYSTRWSTIKFPVEVRQHGRAPAAMTTKWTRCSVRSSHAHFIPDGTYFLHADDGRVHQMKSTSGEWEFLAAA